MTENEWWQYPSNSDEVLDVAEMHSKYGFTLNLKPTVLPHGMMIERYKFLVEEVTELHQAIHSDDFAGMIDALVDLVVVAKGTAVMMGLNWDRHWAIVHEANMLKERGIGKRGMEEDLIKPPGWIPPDHQKILDEDQ